MCLFACVCVLQDRHYVSWMCEFTCVCIYKNLKMYTDWLDTSHVTYFLLSCSKLKQSVGEFIELIGGHPWPFVCLVMLDWFHVPIILLLYNMGKKKNKICLPASYQSVSCLDKNEQAIFYVMLIHVKCVVQCNVKV